MRRAVVLWRVIPDLTRFLTFAGVHVWLHYLLQMAD